MYWVGPPPTNRGMLGIYKDPHILTLTSCGHYSLVEAQPKVCRFLNGLGFRVQD